MLASSFELLKKYKIPVASYGVAKNFQEASLIAENLGFPIVLKIDSGEILHKTDVGGVKIVYSEHEFPDAFKELFSIGRKNAQNFSMVVQEFSRGYEAILGAKLDGQFGKVIMFGTGGIYTQAVKDVTFRLVPLESKDALEMIQETNVGRILDYRGKKIPVDDLVKVILNTSRMVENEDIKELDINPLFLGEKIIAADARVLF